jgi:hypothetical protein
MGANLGPKQANTRSTDWRHHRTTPINIEKRFYTTKTHSGSGRFVLTNLKCKSEIRIVARILLTFEGREVRSGDALSFPRNIG